MFSFNRRWKAGASLGLFIALFAVLSLAPLGSTSADGGDVYTSEFDARIAQEWMKLLYDRIEVEAVSAPAASRLYAYLGVTLYESVLPGMPGNNSLAGQIAHMPDLPWADINKDHDWPTVANEAMSTVMHGLFEFGQPETHDAIERLHDEWAAARESEVNRSTFSRSVEYGAEVGNAILDWMKGDNYYETRSMAWQQPTGDAWLWTPTGQNPLPPVEPHWGQIRPFGLDWADECAVPNNMPYSEDPESTFYKQAFEVWQVGQDLTDEQKAIARWWIDTPGMSGTPAGHWVMIENQLVDQLGLSLDRAAQMYAMVGITLADSFISCWSLKYQENLLRPVSYINQHIRRSWNSYLETPQFPEYPSGHSVVSAAAADVLTSLFGAVAFTDSTHTDEGEAPRHYTSFEQAADEAAISRLYGGIHFRTAIENGMRQGRCIAQHELDNIVLNPIQQGE